MTAPSSRARTPWAGLSLAHQLPLLTAVIVTVVMALLLTLTYRALVSTRAEAMHARLQALRRTLVMTGETSARTRERVLRQLSSDSALIRALAAPSVGAATDPAVLVALGRFTVGTDSTQPVELWTSDGQRVARFGGSDRADSLAGLVPELRSLRGTTVSRVPTGSAGPDSVERGAFFASGGQVYYWTIVPVMRDGARLGFVAQQRRVVRNPVMAQTVRDLSGEAVTVYVRNTMDDFWSTMDGKPATAPVRRDTAADGFIATRASGEAFIGTEGGMRSSPYLFVLEAPQSAIVAQPRVTIRRIALLSVAVLLGAVLLTWLISRRITRPLVALTTAAEAIAQGNYARRVEPGDSTSDEVLRLGASFNRMAAEVEASQHELATQVEEALSTSEELEQSNAHLLVASMAADDARDAALDANRAKSDFLAVMSHELRTPLNAIGGYTEILQIGIYGELNDAQRDALVRIARSQQLLLALINDVLNFAKLEAGEVRYNITDVPIGAALASIEALIAPQLRDRRMSYAVHPCADVYAHADSDKMQQVLINLVSNAIKYTPDGGRIDVSCEATESQVHVHVRDTGIGIARNRLVNIFDPFIQVGRALNRPHEGVGLGLSISRDLAHGMGGSLSVASELAKGSTFTLTLERSTNGSTASTR